MKSFFKYYGGKVSVARHYGPPTHEIVIEPFCGAAGFCTYWNVKHAILIEKDPTIYAIWDYLINHATYDEIMSIDTSITSTAHLDYCDPIINIISFFMGRGDPQPLRKQMTPSNEKAWSPNAFSKIVSRIARQIDQIKDWTIIHGDYTDAPNIEAHWFIDPPYQYQGKLYKEGSNGIDYEYLGEWCKSRMGSVVVCEAEPADWLPFDVFRTCRNQKREKYNELVWRKSEPKSNLFEGD